jgi:adenosylcobinamide-GDP ribazoletransferase
LGFFIALKFLTVLPAPSGRDFSARAYGQSLPYFPLVGLILGIILSALYLGGRMIMPLPLVGGLLAVVWLLLTGSHHLDGLTDTADGLGNGDSPDSRLEAMKVSVSGVYGAAAAMLLLLVKFSALSSLNYWPVLLAIPAVSRWLMVNALFIFPAARRHGFGAEFKRGATRKRFIIATVITLLITLPVMGVLPGLILLAAAWALATGFGWYLKRQLGGLNGDSYGAIGEVSEALTLVLALAII